MGDVEKTRQAMQAISRQALHDVQSPLAVIRMNAKQIENYLSGLPAQPDDAARTYVTQSVAHLAQAAQYIKGLLELYGSCFQDVPTGIRETSPLRDCFECAFGSFPYKRPDDRTKFGYALDLASEKTLIIGPRRHFVLALQYLIRNTLRCVKKSSAESIAPWQVTLSAENHLKLSGTFAPPSSTLNTAEEWESSLEWDYIQRVLTNSGGALVETTPHYCILKIMPLA